VAEGGGGGVRERPGGGGGRLPATRRARGPGGGAGVGVGGRRVGDRRRGWGGGGGARLKAAHGVGDGDRGLNDVDAGVGRENVAGLKDLLLAVIDHDPLGGDLGGADEHGEGRGDEPDAARSLRLHVRNTCRISERVGPLLWAVQVAATVDPDVARLWADLLEQRRTVMTSFATSLAAKARLGYDAATAADMLWALMPAVVFGSAFVPEVASFTAGQAAFTMMVLIFFNLIVPTGWSVGLISLATTVYFISGGTSGLVIGPWVDRPGPRGRGLAELQVGDAADLGQAVDAHVGLLSGHLVGQRVQQHRGCLGDHLGAHPVAGKRDDAHRHAGCSTREVLGIAPENTVYVAAPAAIGAVAGLALPALVRNGIDQGIQTKVFHAIIVVSLIGLAIVVADWVVNILETMVVGRNGERLLYMLRVKLFAQLQRLGLDFYEREMSGRIMTRMTTDVDALSTFLQTGVVTMVSSVLTFFGVLAALLIINLQLGLAVLSIFPLLVAATLVFRAKSSKAYSESREKVAVVNASFAENVAGLRVTQAFRREGMNRDRFGGLSGAFRTSRLRAQRYIAIYFPFVQTLSTAAGAIVLVIATGKVGNGSLQVGALIAYLLYIDMVFAPIQQLSQVFDGYQQAMVGFRRITELLRLDTSTPPAARPVTPGRLRGRIELRDVDFGYTSSEANALNGISLTVKPGETVALVGQTGAGKSTLVKLIARFYDATGGAVLVDGTDVRDYDLADYRHQLGFVPQESYLFAASVRDSIAYASP